MLCARPNLPILKMFVSLSCVFEVGPQTAGFGNQGEIRIKL